MIYSKKCWKYLLWYYILSNLNWMKNLTYNYWLYWWLTTIQTIIGTQNLRHVLFMIAGLDYTYRTYTNVLLHNRTDRQTSRVKPWLDSKLQVTILLQPCWVLTTFFEKNSNSWTLFRNSISNWKIWKRRGGFQNLPVVVAWDIYCRWRCMTSRNNVWPKQRPQQANWKF